MSTCKIDPTELAEPLSGCKYEINKGMKNLEVQIRKHESSQPLRMSHYSPPKSQYNEYSYDPGNKINFSGDSWVGGAKLTSSSSNSASVSVSFTSLIPLRLPIITCYII